MNMKIVFILIVVLSLVGCNATPHNQFIELAIEQVEIRKVQKEQAETLLQLQPLIERIVELESDITVVAEVAKQSQTQVASVPDIRDIPKYESTAQNNTFINSDSERVVTAALPSISISASDEKSNRPSDDINLNSDSETVLQPSSLPSVSTELADAQAVSPVMVLPEPVIIPKDAVAIKANEDTQLITSSRQDLGSQNTEGFSASTSSVFNNTSQSTVARQNYDGCKPQSTESSSELFGIHVSSFRDATKVSQGWNSITKKLPALCERGAVVKEVMVKDKIFYSLRLGPYDNKEDAKIACQLVRTNKQYCRVTDFSGQVL